MSDKIALSDMSRRVPARMKNLSNSGSNGDGEAANEPPADPLDAAERVGKRAFALPMRGAGAMCFALKARI